MAKCFIFSILFIIFLSCNKNPKEYEYIDGVWSIEKLEYKGKDLFNNKSVNNNGNLYIAPSMYIYIKQGYFLIEYNRYEEKFYQGDFTLNLEKQKVVIKECNAYELNGVYSIKLDNLSSNLNFDIYRMRLSSDSTLIVARKSFTKRI